MTLERLGEGNIVFYFHQGLFTLLCGGEFTAQIIHTGAADDGIHLEQEFFLKLFILSKIFIPRLWETLVNTALQLIRYSAAT